MAASIGALQDGVERQLKQFLTHTQIEHEARRCGHLWRKGKLGPGPTIHLLLLQLLAFNAPLNAMRHLAATTVTAGALCQARARLPLQVVRRCCGLVTRRMAEQLQRLDWCGREVLGVDAVHYYTPDTPALRTWLASKNHYGFPLMKVVSLFSLSSGIMLQQVPLPHRRGEAPLLGRLLHGVNRGVVLVMDRAFASFVNLQAIMARQADAVIRLRSTLLAKESSLREVAARLGSNDHLVRWRRPHHRCSLLSRLRWRALPRELMLRQVSFVVRRRGYRSRTISVITTLLDPKLYPASKLAQLYERRWEIELQFRHLKQTLNFESFRCKTIVGVKKELLLRQIAYNLVRAVIAAEAWQQDTTIQRISFIDALRRLLYSAASEPIPLLRVPHRPGRIEPRRLKRQDKNYLPLNCPRETARRKAA